ncbi:calcyphosin-2-like isoform X2 [Tubulanus polymorphus]|uniref:calcyphosin-2-like isoform X2 n=1 Tax=Tubulanus polymorphus TaxID=672921 RepID=UPI003DA3D5AD
MNSEVFGRRTPRVVLEERSNYKPNKRTNPITGTDMPEFRPKSTPARPGSRPEGVPALKLETEEPVLPHGSINDLETMRLETPKTGSTVSWGSARTTTPGAERGSFGKDAMKTTVVQKKPVWDNDPILDDSPPHQNKYIQQTMKIDLKQKKEQESQDAIDRKVAEIRAQKLAEIKDKYGNIDEDEELMSHMKTSHSDTSSHKKFDAEAVLEEKRKQNLIETVMVDQLSKIPMSDNDHGLGAPPLHKPGMARGSIRTLHESNIRTTGTPSEYLLAQRVRFSARLLTRNGHDAVRELMGFFFAVDNSLTVYEYRQFGKSAKALPFLARGSYKHVYNRKKGRPITLCDISPGSTLLFSTKSQKSLPVTVSSNPVVAFRITDVDQTAKESILLKDVRPSEKFDVLRRLHMPETEEELQDMLMLKDVQDFVKSKLKKRGIRTVTGMGLYFRHLDKSGDGLIAQEELHRALDRYHLPISDEDFTRLWKILDLNGDGFLDYGEFMRGVIGEMNEYRKSFVRKAFQRLDPSKKGVISFTQIKKFYKANNHPKVKAGECSEEEVLNLFLQSLDFCEAKDQLSYIEFEEYYEGLSIGIDKDEDFVNIIVNSWGI